MVKTHFAKEKLTAVCAIPLCNPESKTIFFSDRGYYVTCYKCKRLMKKGDKGG